MSQPICFQNIIGFTRLEDLIIPDYDASYSVSDSGLYMDELLFSLRILDTIGGKDDIWDMMNRARDNGINKFKNDVLIEVMKYNEYRREKFAGDVGHHSFTQVIAKDTYHGLRMYSDIRGGVFTLRGVTLNLNSTEAVDLLIYDDFELLYTIPLISSANKPKLNTITPVDLILQGNYYFIYAPAGTPFNNRMTCGCGGYKWCFNITKPCYKTSRDNWTQWAIAGGVHGDDPTDRDGWGISQYAQGLRLHGEFKCDAMQSLCSESSDFENNEIDRAIAYACLYKSTEFLIYELQKSTEVDRNKLIGDDIALSAAFTFLSDHYSDLINYIAEYIEPSRSDCLKCRPSMGIGRVSQQL